MSWISQTIINFKYFFFFYSMFFSFFYAWWTYVSVYTQKFIFGWISISVAAHSACFSSPSSSSSKTTTTTKRWRIECIWEMKKKKVLKIVVSIHPSLRSLDCIDVEYNLIHWGDTFICCYFCRFRRVYLWCNCIGGWISKERGF